MRCTKCNKDVKVGEWMCNAIEKHSIEPKNYYLKDAPNDPTAFSFKHARTDVHNIPPQRSEKTPEGTLQIIPGGYVTFVRGHYQTDDPEIQYYLDRRNISVSKEEWEANYFTVAEKQARREVELKQRESAIAARENELLNKIKAEKSRAAV